jgi:DNA-directed RNA polymerase specialized sigma24 family protein
MDISPQLAIFGLNAEVQTDAQDARFACLVERQSRFVFRVAYAILRNTGDSEDVAQETFLRIYRSLAWERMEDERAFLARTAWRIAVDIQSTESARHPGHRVCGRR